MPDVPADHVGDGERTLHHRADLVALARRPPTSAARRRARARARTARRSRRSARRCTARSRRRRTSCFSRAFSRSVRTIRRYWPDSSAPSSSRNTCAVHSWIAAARELARLVERGDERVAAERRGAAGTAAPTTRARSPRRTRARRAAGRPSSASRVLGRDRGDLVLADQRVAADERRRRDRLLPARLRRRTRDRTTAGCRRRTRPRRCGTCRTSAACSTAASGCGSGMPMRARSRATPSSVMRPVSAMPTSPLGGIPYASDAGRPSRHDPRSRSQRAADALRRSLEALVDDAIALTFAELADAAVTSRARARSRPGSSRATASRSGRRTSPSGCVAALGVYARRRVSSSR